MTTDYKLTLWDTYFGHHEAPVAVVHDGDLLRRKIVDSEVASGDYFMTLATRLNLIAAALASQRNSEAPAINTIVNDLVHLHHNYKIVPKSSTDKTRY